MLDAQLNRVQHYFLGGAQDLDFDVFLAGEGGGYEVRRQSDRIPPGERDVGESELGLGQILGTHFRQISDSVCHRVPAWRYIDRHAQLRLSSLSACPYRS